jgi:hypothetical protein
LPGRLNGPFAAYDIRCGTCFWIIATVRIVPDGKPWIETYT